MSVSSSLGEADHALTEKLRREEALDPLVTPTRLPAARRIIAIGDLHGDLTATRAALRLAGVIDARDKWTGGDTVVVQVGDVFDRGDEESAVYDLLRRLAASAARHGGGVHMILGNHEIMNVGWDFRYVTPAGFRDFAVRGAMCRMAPAIFSSGRLREQCEMYEKVDGDCPEAAHLPEAVRARACAFRPGGPVARRLAQHNTVLVVGDNVFVHGGLHGRHVRYGLERINREVRDWILGKDSFATKPACVTSGRSVVWSRVFSRRSVDDENCSKLAETLKAIPAKRMIIGHTVQENGVNCACDGAVWRLDVGMARGVNAASPEVLEIRGGTVTTLRYPAAAGGRKERERQKALIIEPPRGKENAGEQQSPPPLPQSPLARAFKLPLPPGKPRPAPEAPQPKPLAPRLALPVPPPKKPAGPSDAPHAAPAPAPQPSPRPPAPEPAARPQTAPAAPKPAAPVPRPATAPPSPAKAAAPPKPAPAPAAKPPAAPAAKPATPAKPLPVPAAKAAPARPPAPAPAKPAAPVAQAAPKPAPKPAPAPQRKPAAAGSLPVA